MPMLAGLQTTKYRPLVIRMLIACATVALALVMMVPSVSNAADVVNLNKATSEVLQTLPDIGEKRAKAIISYRKKNGGFKDKKDLLNVPGIGDKILSKISRRVSVSGGGLSLGSSAKSDTKKSSKKSTTKSKTKTDDKKADKRSSSKAKSDDKKKSKTKEKSSKKKSSSKTDKKKKSSSSSKPKKKKKSSS